jgi:hypothetical protein
LGFSYFSQPRQHVAETAQRTTIAVALVAREQARRHTRANFRQCVCVQAGTELFSSGFLRDEGMWIFKTKKKERWDDLWQ